MKKELLQELLPKESENLKKLILTNGRILVSDLYESDVISVETFREEEEEPDYGITTGLDSSNPYRVYLHYWQDLFRRAGEANGWRDKILVFLSTPAWNPKDATPTAPEFHVDENGERLKYKSKAPFRLQLYVFGSVIMTFIGFVSIMLLKKAFESPSVADLITDPRIIMLTVLVAFSVLAHGFLMERKAWAQKVEWGRLALWAAFLPVIAWNLPLNWVFIPVGYVVIAVFTVWFARLRNVFEASEDEAAQTKPKVAELI